MMQHALKTLGFSSAMLVAATLAVFAQTAPAPQPDATVASGKRGGAMAACRADMKTLCSGFERRGSGRMQCLVENKAKASAECQAVMAAMQERLTKGAGKAARKQAMQACQTDAQTLCATAEQGRGGRMRCLRVNEAKVSPACAQALASLPMRKRDRKGAEPGAAPKAL